MLCGVVITEKQNKTECRASTMTSSRHRLIWWGGMRYRFAMNPMLHRTILRKSVTFAYVHLRENKSKLGLEQGWANSGPRAKCGPPQRFQWPAQAFRKIVKSEISSNFSW